MTYTCACGDTYTEEIAAKGHTLTAVEAKAPTCTEAGYEAYEFCSACDYTTYAEVAATGHTYEAAVTAPTCTEQGYTTYTCACGDTYVADYVDATGHTYTSEVTKVPTHTEAGVMTYTCACGDTYTEEIPASGDDHAYVAAETTAPTCTEAGVMTYTCVCGASYTEEIAAKGHSTVAVEAKAPTCTEAGYEAYEYCTACDYTTFKAVAATGHTYEAAVTAPTCTEQGYTTYTCACGDTYVADEVAAIEHSFVNDVCEYCGKSIYEYIFSVQEPSRTEIRNKDGIVLHANIEGTYLDDTVIEWDWDNDKFDVEENDDGTITIIAKNKGWTTFTATLYDADGNELATDSVDMYSKSGFFDKIGGFFRSLFGSTKIYEK